MADRRTRQQDSPRRRKKESTKAIVDQDEVPRTRAPYQPEEIASSYSSSSSYIDISRTYPSNRIRGFGAIRAFFTAPSEHRRRPRRRASRPYLRGGTSSSSSINTDLAYGTGYIRRRKSDRRRKKGKERETSGRRDPRADRDPDVAILEVGAGLAAIARTQNKLDLAEARKQGIQPPRRSDSSILKQPESNRGLGSSKISHDPDEDGWESATDADSEASSVDLRLAYGHDKSPGWSFFRSRPKRKDSVVDPALFGPVNSLYGVVHEPVGFDDVDYDNLSDYPPPTVAAVERQQGYPILPTIPTPQRCQTYPPIGESPRRQAIPSGTTSATGPMQYVYPVPTSDPTRFDAERGSVVSAQDQYGSRPAPVPIQQPPIQIQQPQPKPIVAQSVFEPPYSTRSEPKAPSSSTRTKSSVAGAALAGVAGGIIASSISSDGRDGRGDKSARREEINAYDDDRRAEVRNDYSRKQSDVKDADGSRRERRRDRDREEGEETREERRERRRREKRDALENERRDKRPEKRREETLPDGEPDEHREVEYADRAGEEDDTRRTRKDVAIVPPVNPFLYQVPDDAFKTPDGTRNSEPFTGIQRARSPAVVTVERVPHWHRDASSKEVTEAPAQNVEGEKDLEAHESQQTEQEAKQLYKEIEHSTIPVDSTAVSVAVIAEENRSARERVRKRRYDRSGDSSPKGERDPIQEEADRIYREAVLARKLAESNNDDPILRIVTPPEMAHKKDKEVLYPVPNADFQLDHVMDPAEFMTSPIKGQGDGFDRIKSISGVAAQDLNRPLLTLVRPTPTPSPAPEEQKSRSKRKESSRGAETSESKTSETGRKQSSHDEDQPESTYRESERKDYSRDRESSEAQKTSAVDAVVTGSKGDATQTPTSANGTKSVTWGENDTREINAESPYEVKDDPISNMSTASDAKDKPKMSKERKASAWGALRGAFMSGAAADIVAKAAETSKDGGRESDRRENEVKSDRKEEEKRPNRKESSPNEPFEYRGVTVEPEHSDNDAREHGPPAVGPKPAKSTRSNMPGAFDDDLDFTATVAAGLQDSGFDPDIVIKDPKYRRRSSPPGSGDPPLAEYKQAYAETVSDVSQYGIPAKETSRDIRTRDSDLSREIPAIGQLVEEPESLLESSKPNKKDKKRDKSRKSKDSYDEIDDRGSKKISVPVDSFDDLRTEAAQTDLPEDWNSGKKSKRKSKRDSDQYDSPRSMSASDMASSMEQSKKKSKDRSSKRSSQYDSEPNPEDVPLPSASEISRDDDYESRKPRGSSKKGNSTSDPVDRDSRSVKSDSSRYADEDDSRSSKKDKRNSGFFSGIFGSSTSKSDPEPEKPREAEEPESKKKKKSKRNSTGNGSEGYSADTKGDTKPSPNGNGYNGYDVDDGDPKRSINGDSKRGRSAEKEESFLDKAGPLGAGAGLAAAIAIATQHQHSKAAKDDTEDLVPRTHTPENTSPTKNTAVEAPREVFEENIVDPDIVQRIPRPSFDPQYGDFLPLPPSNPGSPNVEPEDTLPSLPETPPGTPPKIVDLPARDRSVGSSRRSELPALVKTPSHSAIPIKYIMGNRSTPSSPGMVRAPVTALPSSMSPDALGLHRVRPRPTSWDSTKEIQPLYLLDPNRRAPASQSTDSELQSPVAEDTANPPHIDSLIHAPEVSEEVTSSEIRSIPKNLKAESSDTGLKGYIAQSDSSVAKFPDLASLPPLPISPLLEPAVRGLGEPDFSNLPPLPRSGASTPLEISDLSRLPQLPDSPSPVPVEENLRQSPDRDAAGVLIGAAIGLSAGAIALTSIPERSLHDEEPRSEEKPTEDLPAEYQVEPITKDRSSYLFQATPPTKRTTGLVTISGYEAQHRDSDILPRSMGDIPSVDDVLSNNQDSPVRVRSVERNTALLALTSSIPEEKGQQLATSPTQLKLSDEAEPDGAEPDDANEPSLTNQKKNKKKEKKRQTTQIELEDKSSSGTPASMIDTDRDSSTTSQFSLKKSKKEKKKDKKRSSIRTEADDVFSDKLVAASTLKLEPTEGDFEEEPLQPMSIDAPPPAGERILNSPAVLEDHSAKELNRDDGDKEKYSMIPEIESAISLPSVLSAPTAPIDKEVASVDESSQALLPGVLPDSISSEPSVDLRLREHSSIKNHNIEVPDDAKDDVSSRTGYLPSFGPGREEADSGEKLPEDLYESPLPSSVQTIDDVDTAEVFSLKKSKKDRKKDKKRALEEPENTPDPSLSTALPSALASAIQDPDPSDNYSVKTSKKDKKKDKMNRKSLSRSSTILEPVVDEPTQDADQSTKDLDEPSRVIEEQTQAMENPLEATEQFTSAVDQPPEGLEERQKAVDDHPQAMEKHIKDADEQPQPMDSIDDDIFKAVEIPLPISRTISRTENESEHGDVDVNTQHVSPNQSMSYQPAATAIKTTSTREPENSAEKSRDLLGSSDVDDPSSSKVVKSEPDFVPIKHEADVLDLESENTNVPTESRIQSQAEMNPAEKSEVKDAASESEHSGEYAEPPMPEYVGQELVQIPQLKHDPLKAELSLAEPGKSDEVRTEVNEPDVESSLPDKSIEKEGIHENPPQEFSIADEPLQSARDLGTEEPGVVAATQDGLQGKIIGPFSEPGKTKDSKKSKKKKSKYAPATQDEELSKPQSLVEPSSEPTTAAASEREDLSGFSTPTSKGKGKKKQKRKSIAWDLPEAETEPQAEIPKSILTTNDTPTEMNVNREVSTSPRLDPVQSSPTHDRNEDKLDRIQASTVPEEEFSNETRTEVAERKEGLPYASSSTFSATPAEAEISSTTQVESPAKEYVPSETTVHSPQTQNKSGKAVDTGYFPSAALVLPAAAATVGLASSSETPNKSLVEQSYVQDASSSTEILHEQMGTPHSNVLEESIHVQEPTSRAHEAFDTDAQSPSPMTTHTLPEHVSSKENFVGVVPNQANVDDVPSTAAPHSPTLVGPIEDLGGGKGSSPSAIALLPVAEPAANLSRERSSEQLSSAEDVRDLEKPPLPENFGLNEQPLIEVEDKSIETPALVTKKDVLDPVLSEEKSVQVDDIVSSTAQNQEQLEADREWNEELSSGKKNSKKNKKSRADVSRSTSQADELSTKEMNESEDGHKEIEQVREIQVPTEDRHIDGLEAGYKEDQVLLAKQLQAEFDSGTKKSKGKKSRSTSRTPLDYGSGSSLLEETQKTNESPGIDTLLATEASRETIPDEEPVTENRGRDGLAAGFTVEQLDAARQTSKEFASGSNKSKKDRKRKGLIRSATDESMSGIAGDDGSAETSLATTEADSATDSPYPLSAIPTPDGFDSSFTTKKGKKGKKKQSLLRSFTQDSEDSAGLSRVTTEEPEHLHLERSGKEPLEIPGVSETIPDSKDTPSAVTEEPETISFSRRGKKGSKKRQSLSRTDTQEEGPSSDPMSGVPEQDLMQRDPVQAESVQSPGAIADDIAILGQELNYSLKKGKRGKKGNRDKIFDEVVKTEDPSQEPRQASLSERDLTPKNDPDQGSLADRIWAGVVTDETVQPENKNSSTESEDPLGLHSTKKSKKTEKKTRNNSASASGPETNPTDSNKRVADIPIDREMKDSPLSRTGEVEADQKQPKLFDTWSFSNIPADPVAQDISTHEPTTTPKDIGLTHDPKQEEPLPIGHPASEEGNNMLKTSVSEPHESGTAVGPVHDVETPPPVMPKILAWEDESQPQQTDDNTVNEMHLSDPSTKVPDPPVVEGATAKHGISKPVSAGILAAGAALLAGTSMKRGDEPAEGEALSNTISRSAPEGNDVDSPRSKESNKKRGKRPARLLDRRSPPEDDLFDDPILWDGAEAQKYGDHSTEHDSGDELGFWSAAVEEEIARDESAVDDTEDGPSSMPHKRDRSESLKQVWEPSTVLEHIKTPRKHQSEDVPAAIARDAIIEQEIADEHPTEPEDHNRDIRNDENVNTDNSESVSQQSNVLEAVPLPRSEKVIKKKKNSRVEAWDVTTEDTTANVEPSQIISVDPASSQDVDVPVIEHPQTSIKLDDDMDEQETLSASLPAFPIGTEAEGQIRKRLDEESAEDEHRRREVYLPVSSPESKAIDDEHELRRELDVTPPEAQSQVLSDSRVKDKHRRQESYFPPPSTLPIVIEEEYHKTEPEHITNQRGMDDNNRDSAFVAESPVPFQRRFADDHEYVRDSGVHLRDWGDTSVSKEKPHVASADAALARLSWPTLDEKKETVDLSESQRPKEDRSPKLRSTAAGVGVTGAVAVAELAHLAAQSPSQKKEEHRENAKFDRSITPNMGRLQTPDHARYRPGSVDSNRSSGTPPLRRRDRKLSGDLRSLSQRSQANLAKEAKDTSDAKEAERSPATSIVNINPIANEGRPRVKDMADVYDGYGEGRIGSPMSPTRPHSMRRRQSMQVLDLEARLEQLAAENRTLAEAKELAERSLQSSQKATLALADRDAEVDSLKQTLDWLHREVERLKEVNDGLTSANVTLGRQHNERYSALESQHVNATRELDDLRQTHRGLSSGAEDVVLERVAAATEEKDREIARLRQDLEAAHERIREMQREILTAKSNDNEFLTFRDEDYFDNACQQLCQHVQQWVLRFSKFSDMRACRRTNEINNDKIIDRLDNAVLDGSDVDEYLSDRVKRRDIFMSMTMSMIWEFVFTRYLFGMDREQRQKLKSLEKTLLEVGPPAAVHQWRATTLTLLSKREAFHQQREQDTIAVVQMIFQTLSEILPPPTHLEEQIQEQLMRVMKSAVDLSIEMRTQRAEYMMLPPLQPVYDANGDLASQVQFNAALMNERSGDTVSNEDLEAQNAVVRIVLFPLVVKKGDDSGGGDDEIVVCPAQVLVAKPKRHGRGLTPEGLGHNANHSHVSMQSSMPIDQQVPDI